MEGHWLDGAGKADKPWDNRGIIDIGRLAEFRRRRKMEERGASNEGLRKERLRAASLSERISRWTVKHQTRPHSSDSGEEPKQVHE